MIVGFLRGGAFKGRGCSWGTLYGFRPGRLGKFREQHVSCGKKNMFQLIMVNCWFGAFSAWRIIPISKSLVTPIYQPFRPFGSGTTLLRGLTITMVINHLQVLG